MVIQSSQRCFLFSQVFYLRLMLLLIMSSSSNALTPTKAQIEQFKQLPKAEQTRLAKQMGIDLGSFQNTVGVSGRLVPQQTKTLTQPEVFEKDKYQSDLADQDQDQDQDQNQEKILENYGYSIFSDDSALFSPATDIAVPSNYVLGPGDIVVVQLYGKESQTLQLELSREGVVLFPDIGPMTLAGLTFSDAKDTINQAIQEQMIGIKSAITMGQLKTIRVFVLGDVNHPGSYVVGSLASIINALFISGGVSEIGSLRNIQLKRKGEVVALLDLYDVLLQGDTSSDVRLQPGDVIFVPPVGKMVGVKGEIKRPAIYEVAQEKTVEALIALAGGFKSTAYPKASFVKRIDSRGNRTLLDIDLLTTSGKATRIKDGDIINISPVLDDIENVVMLSGHVKRPGGFTWRKGLRISNVIRSVAALKSNADLDFILIKREVQPSRQIIMLRVNLQDALKNKGSEGDLVLHARDEIFVFGHEEDRIEILADVVAQLKVQTVGGARPPIASINGHVIKPGDYPIFQNMTLQGLIDASLDVLPHADRFHLLVISKSEGSGRLSSRLVNLNSEGGDVLVRPGDEVFVFGVRDDKRSLYFEDINSQLKSQTGARELANILTISGSVKSPGEYPFPVGITIESALGLAGGLSYDAYSMMAEITRVVVDEAQVKTIIHIDVDLNDSAVRQSTLLLPEDTLQLKRKPNWYEEEIVTLSGEFRFPGDYQIARGETLIQLISRAGGITPLANASGAVFTRVELKELETQRLRKLEKELRGDIAKNQLEGDEVGKDNSQDLAGANRILDQLTDTEATGRMVIDFDAIIAGMSDSDVVLVGGDSLYLPREKQSVTVVGEVQFPTSHLVSSDTSGVDSYILASGGLTTKADKSRIYIVKANGRVVKPSSRKWFFRNRSEVEAGDTIVIPLDANSISQLKLWTDVTQIIYQIGLGAAAIGSL